MASSGTTAFDLNIDEVIDEAYERCGLSTQSGYDLKRARRNLNLLFSEWGNRGVHLWKVALNEVALVNGQPNYTTPAAVSDVLEAFVSSTNAAGNNVNTQDVSLTKIDRSAYAALPNKYATGQPSQYYVDRQITPIIYLYQAPNLSTYTTLKYYSINRIEDAGAYGNTPDTPFRFLPCMVSGLAYYISFMKAAEKTQMLKLAYEDEMKRALDEDGSRTSLYIAPQTYFGDGV
tara:strand:+ start:1558 stop:2253 length:696 start_codon:yes stop_codon:yes gene_type:complete